jgi:hypothetical protein
MKRFALSTLGGLVFLTGILLELSLSGGVLWGEVEARIYTPQIGESGLAVKCPFILSPSESGIVSAAITNTLDEATSPVVTAEISRSEGQQQLSQTLTLAAHETRTLQWTVDRSDILFDRLILVNIVQSRYSDLPPRQGACGILVFNLPSLNGIQSFILLFLASLISILMGATIWFRANRPLNEIRRSTAQACVLTAGMATAGLLTALPHWWGLILFFDFLTLIILAVVLTEFVLFPRHMRN